MNYSDQEGLFMKTERNHPYKIKRYALATLLLFGVTFGNKSCDYIAKEIRTFYRYMIGGYIASEAGNPQRNAHLTSELERKIENIREDNSEPLSLLIASEPKQIFLKTR